MEKHPLHIKNPNLQKSAEVSQAVKRKEARTGERLANDPSERIEAYLSRLENIFLNPNEQTSKRNLELLRDKIYDALIIKKENFPQSYFDLQKRIARERGEAVKEIPKNVREQMMDTAIEDQKHSLDAWIDYLSSDDAVYPTWFKFYVWNQIIKLSQFDKERGEFKKRTDSTVAPFPDIYREPLAQIADLYERVKDNNKDSQARIQFDKKFPSLYAELIQKSLEAQNEKSEGTAGEWIKYEQGKFDQAEALFKSLEGKGTGWCTAGRSTAETQVKSGDFYVYYTLDSAGNPTQPRLAIRMNGKDKIGEVRGVLPSQEVEPLMQEVLDKKLDDFGSEANVYRKKSTDMKKMTELVKKQQNNEQFTKQDLTFLYELNQPIQSFGYQQDPRIQELRNTRDKQADMLTIFECTKEQLATNINEINNHTKAYLGPWNLEIYNKIKHYPNITHFYESFPDKKIFIKTLETDPSINSPQKAEEQLKQKNIYLSDWGKDILEQTQFSQEAKHYDLVRFSVANLDLQPVLQPKRSTTKPNS